MTDDRSLERAARSWLDNGPTQAPDRAVEAALLRIQTTSQERDLRISWRLPKMFTPARVAAAAVLGVLLVGGAFYVLDPSGQRSVGGPDPTPSPTSTASPPPPSPVTISPAPAGTRGDWQAELDSPLTGVAGVYGGIQLSIDWQTGIGSWIQTEAVDQAFLSDSVVAPAGEIAYIAAGGSVGCQTGDIGRYSWNRSSDGMYLTLTAIEDACAARAEAYSRTWVHSLSAVNDGGRGVFPMDLWVEATLPTMRWALDDTSLHTFDASDPAISFVAIKDPSGYDQPCASGGLRLVPGTTAGGAASVAAYAEYLRAQPGFDATVTDTQVDGHQAVHVELTPKASFECPSGDYALFHEGAARTITPGDPHSLWIVDVDGPTYIIWYEGEGVAAADEQAVISSLRFLDTLPSP